MNSSNPCRAFPKKLNLQMPRLKSLVGIFAILFLCASVPLLLLVRDDSSIKLNRLDSSILSKPWRHAVDKRIRDFELELNETGAPDMPLRKQPWIVLGSAGTGTRVLHDFLQHVGIEMSHLTNRQKDSHVFIELVKKAPFFSDMPSNSIDERILSIDEMQENDDLFQAGNFTLMKWIACSAADFEARKVDPLMKQEIVNALKRTHKIISNEISIRKNGDLEMEWGYKEPQAMFALPFLAELVGDNEVRMKIVHVIRDGRDIAFSDQHLRKYQQMYTSTLMHGIREQNLGIYLKHAIDMAFESATCVFNYDSKTCIEPPNQKQFYMDMIMNGLSAEWIHRTRVARVWAAVKNMVRKYSAQSDKFQYISVHFEKICSAEDTLASLYKILKEGIRGDIGDVEFPKIETFAKSIDYQKCRVGKYYHHDPVLVLLIEGLIHKELADFGYPVYGRDWATVDQLNIEFQVEKTLSQADLTLPKISSDALCIFTVVTGGYENIFYNWLQSVSNAFDKSSSKQCITILVASNDKRLLTKLKRKSIIYNIPSFIELEVIFWQSEHDNLKSENSQLWKYRLETVVSLLRRGLTVMISDVDALFLQNPIKLLEYPHDIISSRGRFPYAYNSTWGGTACMGWAVFRPSALPVLYETLSLVDIVADDQIALNMALERLNVQFDLVDTMLDGKFENGSIAIIDFQRIPRFCKDDLKQFGIGPKDEVDGNWLATVYPSAVVIHCYTPKEGHVKEGWLRFRKLWFI